MAEQSEQAFGIRASEVLGSSTSGKWKGVGNIPPPFVEFRIAPAHIAHVAYHICGIREHRHHIRDHEPPFVVVQGAAYFLALEKRDARAGFVSLSAHGAGNFGRCGWTI